MAARVKIVVIAGRFLQTAQIVRHHLPGELPQIIFGGAGIHRVGGMGHQRSDMVLFRKSEKCLHILRVYILGLSSPGIAGEEGENVRVEFGGFLPHGEIPAGGGNVAADMQLVFHDDRSFW